MILIYSLFIHYPWIQLVMLCNASCWCEGQSLMHFTALLDFIFAKASQEQRKAIDECLIFFWLNSVFLRLSLGTGGRKVLQRHATKDRLQPAEFTGDTTCWRNNLSSWCPVTAMLWIPHLLNETLMTYRSVPTTTGAKWSDSHTFNPLLTSHKATAGLTSE